MDAWDYTIFYPETMTPSEMKGIVARLLEYVDGIGMAPYLYDGGRVAYWIDGEEFFCLPGELLDVMIDSAPIVTLRDLERKEQMDVHVRTKPWRISFYATGHAHRHDGRDEAPRRGFLWLCEHTEPTFGMCDRDYSSEQIIDDVYGGRWEIWSELVQQAAACVVPLFLPWITYLDTRRFPGASHLFEQLPAGWHRPHGEHGRIIQLSDGPWHALYIVDAPEEAAWRVVNCFGEQVFAPTRSA